MKKIGMFLLGLVVLSAGVAEAREHPFNISLIDPVQLVDDKEDLTGLRLNILYGKNQTVKGLDFGIGVGHSQAGFKGLGLHYAANFVQGDGSGILLGGINIVTGDFGGLQLGAVNKVVGSARGLQLGYVSIVDEDFSGLQLGIVNLVHGNFSGIQLGLVNIGGIESGIQIGLANINKKKRPLPFFPIINARF